MTKVSLKNDEKGLVAIFSTIIIMFVITLVVIGFSQVAATETKDTTNDELSTEAYYAAESGVNDAYTTVANIINANQANPDAGSLIPAQTLHCNGPTDVVSPYQYIYPFPSPTQQSNILNPSSSANAAYSCLLVNAQPKTLTYNNVPAGSGQVIPIEDDTLGQTVQYIVLQWSTANSTSSCGSYESLGTNPIPPWPSCSPPPLRVDLLPVNFTQLGGESQADFANNVKSFFLFPENARGGNTCPFHSHNPQNGCINFSSINSSEDISASCTATCTEDINLNGYNNSQYYMRVMPVVGYGSATIQLCANATASQNTFYNTCPNTGGTPINLEEAEAQIDSTGIASNVLRRIQVNVAINPASIAAAPQFAVQSGSSICKRIIYGTGVGDGGTTNVYEDTLSTPIPSELVGITNSQGDSISPTTDPCSPIW